MTTQQTDGHKRLVGRLALVTGATRGIGRAIALAFAQEGADLILLGRTAGALEELDDTVKGLGVSSTLVPLDIKDFDALDRLGEAIHGRWGKLDILVGNAGVLGPISPVGHITPKDWQGLLDVNVTANWRLMRSLDPLLRQSDAGRAIFVSSALARAPRAFWGGYAMSKAALEAVVLAYAAECQNTAVRVNLVHPGAVRTALRAKAAPGEDPETLPRPEELGPLFVSLAEPSCQRHGDVVRFERDMPSPASGPEIQA
ncbi:MAG: SDR family NAD(P)-dependent oxidoreductase [Alphaproteobacteria bacterium]